MKKFVCKVCGYVYEGEAAPEFCPVCKAPASMFEEVKGEMKLAAEHEFGVYETTVRDMDSNGVHMSDCRDVFFARLQSVLLWLV